jgi:DNA-binding MarR family transcriptional regulator
MSLNRPDPADMAQVAALLAMDRTTLTANLKPLQRRGLVDVAKADNDRRRRLLTLTPGGRTILAAAVPVWQRTHRTIEALLGTSSPNRLRADLRALS